MARADLQPVIEAFWAALSPEPPASGSGGLDVGALRSGYERFAASLPLPPDVHVVAVDAGGTQAEWVAVGASRADRVLLHVHGGGHALGSPRTHRSFAAHVAAAAQARVLLPDIRLAPEHPHPAALEDVLAAYRHLLAEGVGPDAIVLGGDSSGAGVVLAALMALRDAGDPLPAGAALISPWADLPCEEGSRVELVAQDPISSVEGFATLAALYAPGRDLRDPSISPLFGDFAGLPPLLVQVGAEELVLDDATRIVARAREAGGSAELETWPEMFHNFQLFAGLFPAGHEAWRALASFAAFVRARAGGAAEAGEP